MSNGLSLRSIYLFTPFPILIYLFLFVSFCSFTAALTLTQCARSAYFFPGLTNRLSEATSAVKLYLSHIGVHFGRNMIAEIQTHFSIRYAFPKVSFLLFHFLRKKGGTLSQTLFEIHLRPQRSLLLFNHILSKNF